MTSHQTYYKNGFSKLVADTHAWRSVANAVPFTIPYLQKTDKLLDVGLGPGTISRDFANYVGEVVGIEPTQELVDLASQQNSLPDHVSFQLALAYDLPFEDDSFDVVHALQVIIHLKDPASALREMLRVCKPQGHVLIKDADLKMTLVFPEYYSEELAGYFIDKYKCLDTLPVAGRLLKSRAMAAGYDPKLIQLSGSVWVQSTDEERRHWADMYCRRILGGSEQNYEDNKEKLDKVIRAFQKWKEDPEGVMVMVHGELVYQKP